MSSGQTMIEKIFKSHSDNEVSAGKIAIVDVDSCMGTDGSTPMAIDYFKKMNGNKVVNAENVVFFADHYSPAPNQIVAELHSLMNKFSKEHGCNYFSTGKGIGNQVMMEKGFVHPGEIVLGADSHACTFGALNAFAFGIGSSDLATILISGKLWLKVPETIKIILSGEIPSYVSAKDIALFINKTIGEEGASYKTIEFHGEVIDQLSMDSRFILSNMTAELGAKGGIMKADSKTLEWLDERNIHHGKSIIPDDDAVYSEIIEINVNDLSPQVALPHKVDKVVSIESVSDVNVDMVFIGTCTNGRLEDYRIAAKLLKDNTISSNVQLLIVPSSEDVYLQALKEGLIEEFVSKGAMVSPPGCGSCAGTSGEIPADGMNIVSTANRNYIGRMGNPKASIYLASPQVAITAAITGKIVHPRKVDNYVQL